MMKVVKSLEEYGLLIKVVSETVKNELKEKKRRIFRYVDCTQKYGKNKT